MVRSGDLPRTPAIPGDPLPPEAGQPRLLAPVALPPPADTVSQAPATAPAGAEERRIRAVVALRLLEVIRDQDVPGEVLEEEDPAVTLPRRLGLSDVVERQIRSYRDDVRKRIRLADSEIVDLFRLVIRRPDAEEIFYKTGRMLAGEEPRRAWWRVVPGGLSFFLARRRVRRSLKRLFGRGVGGFGGKGFAIEGRSLLFINADPGGEACAFVSGFCEVILSQVAGREAHVSHTHCQAHGGALCRWEGLLEDPLEDIRPQEGGKGLEADIATSEVEGDS